VRISPPESLADRLLIALTWTLSAKIELKRIENFFVATHNSSLPQFVNKCLQSFDDYGRVLADLGEWFVAIEIYDHHQDTPDVF
jgi:hypothetical protein